MPLHNQDLAQLRALNRRFIHNFVTNDVAGHDAILHPEFIEIGTSGACQNRASYLREWATGFDPEVISYWDMLPAISCPSACHSFQIFKPPQTKYSVKESDGTRYALSEKVRFFEPFRYNASCSEVHDEKV